jgi:hypothetical protein
VDILIERKDSGQAGFEQPVAVVAMEVTVVIAHLSRIKILSLLSSEL